MRGKHLVKSRSHIVPRLSIRVQTAQWGRRNSLVLVEKSEFRWTKITDELYVRQQCMDDRRRRRPHRMATHTCHDTMCTDHLSDKIPHMFLHSIDLTCPTCRHLNRQWTMFFARPSPVCILVLTHLLWLVPWVTANI